MRKFLSLTYLLLCVCVLVNAQTYKFYYSNYPKFLKQGSDTDTLRFPFTGGMNSPQISNIDFNHDGKKDIFIFDRSSSKVLAFTYDTTGFVYSPQYEGQFPEMTSWAILRDFNNDGKEDIFTETTYDSKQLVDTIQDVYANGLRILKNTSTAQMVSFKQLNNQVMDTGGWWGPPFNMPRLPGNVAINRSDVPLIGDMDGDGDLDIISYNLFNFSPNFYDNFIKNNKGVQYPADTVVYIMRDECWGYMQFDASSGTNRFKLHQGKDELSSCFFQMYGKAAKHSGTTQLMLDCNGDGVNDVIYGDVSYNNLLLLVNGRAQNSLGRDSIISQDTLFPSNTTPANFIVFPAAYYADINGDGISELLVTTNETTAAKNTANVWAYDNTGTQEKPVFSYSGNRFFAYDETIDLGSRTVPVLVDIDADGDKDLLVATSGNYEITQNMNDRLVWFENITDSVAPVFRLKDDNFLQLSKDTPVLDIYPSFADLNGDGKTDMVLGVSAGYILYYTNQSSGSNISFKLETRTLGSIDVGTNSAPFLVDLNKDGKIDIMCGSKDGSVNYYQNTGSVTNPRFSATPTIDSIGGVAVNDSYYSSDGKQYLYPTGYATPYVADLDQDGTYEMLVGSEGGKVFLYRNVTAQPGAVFPKDENLFVDYSDQLNAKPIRFGTRSAPCVGYLDGDNKPDILIGNIRGGLSFYASVNRGVFVGLHEENPVTANLTVYPNPATDMITLATENMNEDAVYSIYTITGQKVITGRINKFHSETNVSIRGLTQGMYFVVLEGGSYKLNRKLLVR